MAEHDMPTVLAASDPDAVTNAGLALEAGGIVGVPTETVYGLAVLPRPAALAALLVAKQRPQEKGIAVLIDELVQVEPLVIVPAAARDLAATFWPGPLTLVLPLREPDSVPGALSGGQGTLGVRIPDHGVPRALARLVGPIATTSANRSGEPEARSADELMASVGASLALILDDGPVRGGIASTVVRVDADGAVSVLREGALGGHAIKTATRGDRR